MNEFRNKSFNGWRDGALNTPRSGVMSVFALIAVNVLIMIAAPERVERSLILSPDVLETGRFWQLVTAMFVHANFEHILFNMLWLYWFGTLFLQFFSAKHLRGVYLLGGICGGLLYMVSYNVFPYFQYMIEGSFLLGASASVLAIVAATAYREPNYPIQLFLFGTVRLKYLALIVIGMDLLFITSSNAGGHISHLGGALAGLWFAASLSKGKDITAWINRLLDSIEGLFSPRPRKPKMKINYGGNRQKDYEYNARKKSQSDEIDRILEKLKKSGYESLTAEEKKSLFDASKR